MRVIVTRTLKRVVKLRYEGGALNVEAYCFLPRKKLIGIISENIEWIKRRQAKDGEATAPPKSALPDEKPTLIANPNMSESDLIKELYAGRKMLLLGDVVNVAASVSNKIYLERDTLYLPEAQYMSRETRLKATKAYAKKMCALYIAGEVSDFGCSMSLCPAKIEFKDLSDCWMKCTLAAQKVLCLNYRIVHLPQNLRKYLIVHAFAHFNFPTHDDKFWNFVSNVSPHFEDGINELDKYSFLLEL